MTGSESTLVAEKGPCWVAFLCCVPEKGMAAHSSILAWKIPWAEEPVKLQSMGLRRVGHDWATSLSLVVFSAVGPGASVEDWPEEAGDGVQASDRRHHWRKDLPPVSAHSCAPRPKLLSRLWVSERERHAARVWSRGFLRSITSRNLVVVAVTWEMYVFFLIISCFFFLSH